MSAVAARHLKAARDHMWSRVERGRVPRTTQGMKSHAKQAEAPATSSGAPPAWSPDAANSVTATPSRSAARTTSRGEPLPRLAAALEALAFWALILFYMWRVEPAASPVTRMAWLVGLGLMPLVSIVLHRDDRRELGLGLRGIGRSALEVGTMTLAGSFLIAAAAIGAGRRQGSIDAWPLLPGYFVWGFLQQFALQAFVHRRLGQALAHPHLAAATASVLFGSLHLPNPVLAPATTLAGFVWASLYARKPNLWTLAASHAWLAALVLATLPPEWVHNLKVGPGYLTW